MNCLPVLTLLCLRTVFAWGILAKTQSHLCLLKSSPRESGRACERRVGPPSPALLCVAGKEILTHPPPGSFGCLFHPQSFYKVWETNMAHPTGRIPCIHLKDRGRFISITLERCL